MNNKNVQSFGGDSARLFPVSSPSERIQTSVFLSVLVAVPELAKQLLEAIGVRTGSRSSVETFTEGGFKGKSPIKDKPDGLIVVTKKKNVVWRALLEVKTGNTKLDAEQIERYLQIAKTQNLNAVITISNQLVARPNQNPVVIQKKNSQSVGLFHWSWKFIQTEAKLLANREVLAKRSCEAFILSEYIWFLNNKVGISGIDSMPRQSWKKLIQAAGKGVMRKDSQEIQEVVTTWYSEVRDLQLQLCQSLNLPPDKVKIKMSNLHISDPKKRLESGCRQLVENNKLEAEFKIDNAASDLKVIVDIATKKIIVSMELDAPGDGPTGYSRVKWLLKQFEKIKNKGIRTDKLFVLIYFKNRQKCEQRELKKLMSHTIDIKDFNKLPLPRMFEIYSESSYNDQIKFSNPKEFIKILEISVHRFYNNIGCNLSKWTPPAPKPNELLVEELFNSTDEVDTKSNATVEN